MMTEAHSMLDPAANKAILIDSPGWSNGRYGYTTWKEDGSSQFTALPDPSTNPQNGWIQDEQRKMGEGGRHFVIAGTFLVRIETMKTARFTVDDDGRVTANFIAGESFVTLCMN